LENSGDSYRDSNYKVPLRGSKFHDNQDYFINICAPLVGFTLDRWSTEENGLVAGWEENPDNANRSHVLASVTGAKLEALRDDDLRMTMTGGDVCRGQEDGRRRKVKIALICADIGLGDGYSAPPLLFLLLSNQCSHYIHSLGCRAWGRVQLPLGLRLSGTTASRFEAELLLEAAII
jgi:hypothetical protein